MEAKNIEEISIATIGFRLKKIHGNDFTDDWYKYMAKRYLSERRKDETFDNWSNRQESEISNDSGGQ